MHRQTHTTQFFIQVDSNNEPTASQEELHLSRLSLNRHSSIALIGSQGTGKTPLLPAVLNELGIDRWGAPKDNSVTLNANTLRANKTAARGISTWLLKVKGIDTDFVDMGAQEFVKHLAECVLVVSEYLT